jgi:adenylylsulfate kinase-like enzyme
VQRELVYEAGAVLLVAGLPGSGKTTFLRRPATGPDVVVLDSDDVRRRLRDLGLRGRWETLLRPLVHAGHLIRVVRAVSGAGRHERSWRTLRRRLRSGGGLRGEGYASARSLGRGPAAAVERIRFG